MEHWIEVNLSADLKDQSGILLDSILPYVRRLERRRALVTYHYFREPEIRFRIRLRSLKEKKAQERALATMAQSLKRKGLVNEWHFGRHGERGKPYSGEEDRYGRNGWKVAQDYFHHGSETALGLMGLRREGKLESPLWAKGKGNPWEGGPRNPWREREDDPLKYHWSRYVHLFTNQLGFDIDDESSLCAKQSERYARISSEFGIKW